MPLKVRTRVAADGIAWWVLPGGRRKDLSRLAACRSVGDYLGLAAQARLGYLQIEDELRGLVDLAASRSPVRALEIGASWGGTTFALGHALPTVRLLIGIDLYVGNRIKLRVLAREGLDLRLLNGSSRDPRTIAKVRHLLGGELLDLLFIDGDHTYEGARGDFLLYRHLVREGGLIAFHDIQSDGSERGVVGEAWSGGVPTLWRELAPLYRSWEFVASPDQLGYGIGVVEYDASVTVTEGAR